MPPIIGFRKGELEVDADQRRRRNVELLRRQAERLAVSSPFYERRFRESGVDPSRFTDLAALRELPFLTKAEIIADQKQDPPYGSMLAAPPEAIVRQYIGPGPQTTYFTAADYDVTVENAAWAFDTNGYRAEDVIDNTIMYHWVIAGTTIDEAFRRLGCAVIPGGIGNPRMHLEVMTWSKVTGLFVFPTFLDELEAKARELDIEPSRQLYLRLVTISGELRSADAKARMSEFWGAEIREIYGGAEVPFVASEGSCGGGMHLNPDFIFELVHPENGEPVETGEPGVLVVTDLVRQAYPMIRYFTGDITEYLDPSPCPCGRTTGKIGRILGRVGDIPRVKGLFVVPSQVRECLTACGVQGRFQLVVERPGTQDSLTIKVEGEVDAGRVAAALKEAIRMSVTVESVPPGALADAPLVDDRRVL
ncbi:MAG: phenylacetate--CoA ligase [Acidimicrobiia bacterium]|nr:MAG: phenylacetate--CoA ligase [Acidimicrobiia bacterium]